MLKEKDSLKCVVPTVQLNDDPYNFFYLWYSGWLTSV